MLINFHTHSNVLCISQLLNNLLSKILFNCLKLNFFNYDFLLDRIQKYILMAKDYKRIIFFVIYSQENILTPLLVIAISIHVHIDLDGEYMSFEDHCYNVFKYFMEDMECPKHSCKKLRFNHQMIYEKQNQFINSRLWISNKFSIQIWLIFIFY